MKFNFFKRASQANEATNHAGGTAFALTSHLELYSAVVTTALSDKFYESGDDRFKRILNLIDKADAEFVAKLAVYARNNMHMRSVPLVLAVELAKRNTGNALVSKTVKGVVKRADEITELLAYYQLANDRTGTKKLNKLSNQMKKGLAEAFNSFDEYQFAKYDRSNTSVALRDALFLVHPKATSEENQVVFNKIANKTLATPYTWETELSALGKAKYANDKARKIAFRNKWEELIDSGKVGYMALLRNLRNILEANVEGYYMEKVCALLSDERAVANSKQLPFRFLAAYREVRQLNSGYVGMVLDALEKATVHSAANLNGFDVKTNVLVACDVSGSMQKPVSPRSKVLLYDIGLMMGMLVKSRCKNVVTGMFGDRWKMVSLPNNQVLANVGEFYRREGEVGYSTNGYLVIEDLIAREIVMDKVMLFTDCQLWDSKGNNSLAKAWYRYKAIAPNAKLYLFDLAGYGNTPVNTVDYDVFLVAGWSDKVFNVLNAIENGSNAVAEIEAMELV